MRKHRVGWGVTFALLSALYGAADAQVPLDPPAPPRTGADTAVGMQQQVQLSPQEQLTQADTFVARMGASGATVRRLLEQARAQRDVVKTLCLNDKLNQIDVAVRSGQDRRTTLDQAVLRKDADLANHEFTILQVLKQRVEQLESESKQCIGEELQFVGESKVTTTVEPGMPGSDTTAYPEAPVVVVPPPPACASCVQ